MASTGQEREVTVRDVNLTKRSVIKALQDLHVAVADRDGDTARIDRLTEGLRLSFGEFQVFNDAYDQALGHEEDAHAEAERNLKTRQDICNQYIDALAAVRALNEPPPAPQPSQTPSSTTTPLRSHTGGPPVAVSLTLDVFAGDPVLWPSWWKTFERYVDNTDDPPPLKLAKLQQYTSGLPHKLIAQCGLMSGSAGYNRAVDILLRKYGNLNALCHQVKTDLISRKAIKTAGDLSELGIELGNAVLILREHDRDNEIDHELIRAIVDKLPADLQQSWRQRALSCRRAGDPYPGVAALIRLVEDAAVDADDPFYGEDALGKTRAKVKFDLTTHATTAEKMEDAAAEELTVM